MWFSLAELNYLFVYFHLTTDGLALSTSHPDTLAYMQCLVVQYAW